MPQITTSLVVQFSSSNGGSGISAELDSRPLGLNAGKTSFQPGDSPAILVFVQDGATLDSVECSDGTISSLGSGTYQVEETLVFANTAEVSLSKPYSGGASVTWYGNNLGSITFQGNKATINSPGVGVAKVTYNADYRAYRLNSPATSGGSRNFQIVVVVIGHDDA